VAGQSLFSWAAIGAFLTSLADSAGSNRARLASMGGFALASTLGGMVAATAAGWSVERVCWPSWPAPAWPGSPASTAPPPAWC
jgi:hypothetical protein